MGKNLQQQLERESQPCFTLLAMAASACVASSLAVSTSSSLRSSFVRPCSFRERQYVETRFLAAGTCVAQMSMPKLAEAFQSGMGLELQESLVGLQHDILRNAVELGLPADENVLSYWAIAVPVVLWYSLATPGPLAGLVEFFQGPMHANTFRSFSPEDVEIGRQMGEGSFGIVHEGYIGKGEEWNERWYLDMQDDNTVHLSGPGYSPCIIHCRDYAFLLWN